MRSKAGQKIKLWSEKRSTDRHTRRRPLEWTILIPSARIFSSSKKEKREHKWRRSLLSCFRPPPLLIGSGNGRTNGLEEGALLLEGKKGGPDKSLNCLLGSTHTRTHKARTLLQWLEKKPCWCVLRRFSSLLSTPGQTHWPKSSPFFNKRSGKRGTIYGLGEGSEDGRTDGAEDRPRRPRGKWPEKRSDCCLLVYGKRRRKKGLYVVVVGKEAAWINAHIDQLSIYTLRIGKCIPVGGKVRRRRRRESGQP